MTWLLEHDPAAISGGCGQVSIIDTPDNYFTELSHADAVLATSKDDGFYQMWAYMPGALLTL